MSKPVPQQTTSQPQTQVDPSVNTTQMDMAQRQAFYASIGHPELASRYPSFTVPQGYAVTGVQETSAGLQVQFASTQSLQQQQASQQFYSNLGYPQYGGRYAPFDNPENRPIKNITEIQDNPATPEIEGGLQVEFGMTPEEQYKFNTSSLFWKYAGFPQYAGKYAPVPNPEKRPIKSVKEIPDNPLTPENEAGLQVEFGMTQEEQSKFNQSSLFWKYAGFPQYAGKYAPVPNPENRPIQSVTEIQDNPNTPEIESGLSVQFGLLPAEQERLTASKQFYEGIGYPQFGGRFDPFAVEGQISSIEETSTGLIVRYQNNQETSMPPASHFGPVSPTYAPGYSTATAIASPPSYPEVHVVGLHGAVVSDMGIPTTLSPLAQAQVAAILATPEGMELIGVKETFVQTPADIGREDVAGETSFVAEYKSKTYETPYNLFGLTQYEYNAQTQELVQLVPTKQGETLKLSMGKLSTDIAGESNFVGQPNPAEQSSALGISLATILAGAVSPKMFGVVTFGNATSHMTLPVSGVASFVGVGLAETYKYGTTGEHLTLPEAIGVAGMSQLAVGAYMTFQPRVQAIVKSSGYGQNLQAKINQEYVASQETGKLWEPTLSERLGMKLSGIKVTSHLATGTVPITKNVPESALTDSQAAQMTKDTAKADMVRGFDAKEMIGSTRDLTEKDWLAREIGAVSNQAPKSLYDYPSLNKFSQEPATMSPYNPNEPFTGNLQTAYAIESEWDIMSSFGSQGIMPQEYVNRAVLPKAYGGGGGSSFTTVGIGGGRAALVLSQSIGLSNSPAVELRIAQQFLSQARQITHLQYGTSFYEGYPGVSAITVHQQMPEVTEVKAIHFTPTVTQTQRAAPRTENRRVVANPFETYQGQEYYRISKTIETEETTHISYPSSGLPSPTINAQTLSLFFQGITPTIAPQFILPTPYPQIQIPKNPPPTPIQNQITVPLTTETLTPGLAQGLTINQIMDTSIFQGQGQSSALAQLLKQQQQSRLIMQMPQGFNRLIPAFGGDFGSQAPTEPRGKRRKRGGEGYGRFIWEFPTMEPDKILNREYMGKHR